ncbi:hypothetical protein [uncultured Pseudomonas sp.]|uniref:hypothetical protein n=1 Tax=uncultured Pseudomonas sp. TaxID=114707 RepID=UPI00261BE53C|nr:hypothetical protein [uncultured Pseudomonas sp.]
MRPTLYLKLSSNQMHLTHLQSGRQLHLPADPPFSNQRLLVADFAAAEHLLQRGIAQLLPKRFLRLSLPPQLLIQPLEHLEGGLSQVEERILLELGLGCGARKVRLHMGPELDSAGVLAKLRS